MNIYTVALAVFSSKCDTIHVYVNASYAMVFIAITYDSHTVRNKLAVIHNNT